MQDLYIASFEKAGGPAWVARHGLTGEQLQATFDDLNKQGYRQVCISGYAAGSEARYAGVWVKDGGPAYVARAGLTAAEYQAFVTGLAGQGFRPRSLSAFSVNGEERFAAVFEQVGGTAWVARHGLTAAQYQTAFDDLAHQGFRLRSVSPYLSAGQVRYLAWWDKSPSAGWVARHGLAEAAFRGTHTLLAAQGYDLVAAGACSPDGVDLFAGLWERTPVASEAHAGMTSGAYQAHVNQLVAEGFRPVFVAGYAGNQPVDVNIGFQIQRQVQSNWCWAAVSTSVRHYYQPASTLTQCQLVNQRTNRTDACQPGPGSDPAQANKAGDTVATLDTLGHLAAAQGNAVAYADLRTQLLAGRPVFVRIQWAGGGRHAVAATGLEDDDLVIVSDPGSSSATDPTQGTTSIVDYDVLKTAYSGSGSWIGTGFTKP